MECVGTVTRSYLCCAIGQVSLPLLSYKTAKSAFSNGELYLESATRGVVENARARPTLY